MSISTSTSAATVSSSSSLNTDNVNKISWNDNTISYTIARGIYKGHITNTSNFTYEPVPDDERPSRLRLPKTFDPHYCTYRGTRLPPFTYSGRLELIVGAMYVGKTSELERRARREAIANKTIIIVKPIVDTRFKAEKEIISHDNMRIKALPCESMGSVLGTMLQADVICIDEGQFIPDIVEVADLLCNLGKKVIVDMLHATYDRVPFPKGNPNDLFSMADDITFLTAVCVKCGAEASNSYLVDKDKAKNLVSSDGVLIEGKGEGQGEFQARCRKCFMV